MMNSCSKFQKILKSKDHEVKYDKAIEYYEKGDYSRALQLFDELIIIYRGNAKAQKVYYYYAYCYFNQEEYIMASYHFNNFVKTFPKTEYTEECAYMSAYCQYLDSPKYNLDQTSTYEALKELQLFVNIYPFSPRVTKCNELIDNLRAKLEKKDFEIAKLYFKTEYYKASTYAFKNLIKEYPSTNYKEEALFYILKASNEFAIKSVDKKQAERFKITIEEYKELIKNFPEGKYSKEANNIFNNATKELNKKES